jgi:hypothetical protein
LEPLQTATVEKNPFAGIFDLRLTKDFNAGGRHKFTLSTDVFNFSNY